MGAKPRYSRVVTIGIGLVWLVLSAGSVGGQQSSPAPIVLGNPGGATGVISPVVVAQWFTNRKAGVEELELLVLWRGMPGWFLQPGGSGGSDSGTGSHSTWIKYGAVSVSLEFDATTRRVIIQGKEVTLSDNNVLFVDDVDLSSGPRVVGMMAVSRAMPGSFGQIAPILRSSSRIMSFLRCDAGEGSSRQALLQTLCLQNVGVER